MSAHRYVSPRRSRATAAILATVLALTAPALAEPASNPPPARLNLQPEERNVIALYKRCSPAVVSVANRTLLRDVFSFRVYEVPAGAGSGFVWDRKGHIISNFHVVYQASSLQVALSNGTAYDAQVVGVDPDHDIAVLKISAPEDALAPLEIGTSCDLEVGQTVLAIGNPFGLDTSLSVGIVSALGRNIESMTGRQIFEMIQTDAAINPGNSGGPLLDSTGRLIGMNTAIVSTSGSYAGVGFAVPVDTIRRIVPQLIEHGRVRRAGLGIQILPDHIMKQHDREGVGILRAIPRGAAARAGLQGIQGSRRGGFEFGDVIVGIDSTPVKTSADFLAILDRRQAGDKVKVLYVRDGKEATADIILQAID